MSEKAVRFYDMDQTILNNDCDVSWKLFLIGKGLAPLTDVLGLLKFYLQYKRGGLDQGSFGKMQLREFKGKTEAEMKALSEEHFEKKARGRLYSKAVQQIEEQRRNGDILCIVTAANAVISKPVAVHLGIEHLIATAPDMTKGVYNGSFKGKYCIGINKVDLMKKFCMHHGTKIEECYYYADSINDIPVFEAVGFPVATNPDKKLYKYARNKGWTIMRF